MSGLPGGALSSGALGLLLGSRRMGKTGGRFAKYGGLAALGALAYRAYGEWQQNQRGSSESPRTIDRVPDPEAEEHSMAILKALLGAARADGHIDDRERELFEQEIGKLGDPDLKGWVDVELRRPLDPAEIAHAARSPEMASEMYLASVMVVDEENEAERAYLEALAQRLGLAPELKSRLEESSRSMH